ncbi:hypothetical protein CMT41_01900 [Colwellia sp. MT41]|nr:hypothetical protein CMT41_01900 [Colwellia sp. MT41]
MCTLSSEQKLAGTVSVERFNCLATYSFMASVGHGIPTSLTAAQLKIYGHSLKELFRGSFNKAARGFCANKKAFLKEKGLKCSHIGLVYQASYY